MIHEDAKFTFRVKACRYAFINPRPLELEVYTKEYMVRAPRSKIGTIWNNLSDKIRKASSLNSFKKLLFDDILSRLFFSDLFNSECFLIEYLF